MRILIAEDESGAALILRRTLEKIGHEVTVAVNGAEAWEMLQRETFPLVISDWMMPRLDGPTLCRRIRGRQESSYTYLILLTSRNERQDRLEGLHSGADDFLAKPLGHGELSARLGIAQRILTMQYELQHLNARMAGKNQELGQIVTRLEEANARLAEMATCDGLTGLKNHRFLQDSLHTSFSFARREGLPLSLILLDVDRFKDYNDSFGHPAGDEVLCRLAGLLRRDVREHDVVARYGGEEFALLLPATAQDEALLVARRVREVIAGSEWPLRPVTVSIGVATYETRFGTPMPETAAELVDEADAALYRSKHLGRNRVTHIREVTGALRQTLQAT